MLAPSLYVHVALYIRLSVEDNKKRGCSVENQKLVLNDFLSDKPDFVVYDTYIDNGATGTNFHRPGFQQMLSDIEAGHINCVIVKDLSRLGRNSIDTGYYIEQYFHAHNVRFIAVTDQFDTADSGNLHGGIMLPLKNMINEAYALDIGRKIKAQARQAMPVLDGSFEAFVTNLGKYNEGELVGEWVHFPTTEEEMKEVFERIGIGSKGEFGQVYEEWFITDYDCSIHGVSNLLGEYENLDKLNYLAARLDEMSRSELEHFMAIMDSGCDEVNDLDDLINLTYNLDNYDFIPDIKDYDDLGRYYFFEGGYNIDNKFGSFVDYIDFERYGEDCAINEGGTLTDAGYIRPTGDSWNRYFDGTLEDIPDEYRVTGSGEELEQPSTITVLVVEPDKKPYVKEIPSSLESLQHEVGGDIEAVYPFEEPVAIVCNGEGKMNGLPLNRALRDDNGEIYDIVAGTFLVTGLTDDSFGSLSPDLLRQFVTEFKMPEQFAKIGDRIVAIPMISEEQQKQTVLEEKSSIVNENTSGMAVDGHIGTWHTIDHKEIDGHTFWLMEHDTFGDDASCIIVDERGELVLSHIYDGFDETAVNLLRQEVMPVEKMPDGSISIEEMKQYGYKWGGMLPMREEAAAEVMKSCQIYRLYGDDTEGLVLDAKEIKEHAAKGGIFGVEKADWVAELEKQNPLKAAEMSLEDDYGMIDGIINNGSKEKESSEKREKSSIMDRLKAAKSSKPQVKSAPSKEKKSERDL